MGQERNLRQGRERWRRGGDDRAIYGAVDLGTNNCRMILASPAGDGFRVVDSFSRIVRLGEGLGVTGQLGERAMERAIGALKVCAGRMARRETRRVRCIATEACRAARNCADFLDRVLHETGLVLEPISAEEEARLTLAGCAPLFDGDKPRGLAFDIGGGSTELMWIEPGRTGAGRTMPRMLGLLSIPLGVVGLAEQYGPDRISPADFATIVARVDQAVAAFDTDHDIAADVAGARVGMLGTSGTVTTLGGIHLDLPRYDRSRVDGLTMDVNDLLNVSARLATLDRAARAAHPCIGWQRADLVVVGCAILEAICRRWPVERLRIADRGVREGLLLAMMADHP